MSPSLSGFRAGLEVMRVRIRGALGDIDPLNKVPLIRVKKGPPSRGLPNTTTPCQLCWYSAFLDVSDLGYP